MSRWNVIVLVSFCTQLFVYSCCPAVQVPPNQFQCGRACCSLGPVQGMDGSFPWWGNFSNLLYIISFSYTSHGRRVCCVQVLLLKVMRIYSLQLTSSHKVLSWLYLFMVPCWCRFVRCIWSLFFPPLLLLGLNSSLRWWKTAPLYFKFKFMFNI